MRELSQIESPSEHSCEQPSIERWQVLEPLPEEDRVKRAA